SARPLRSPAPRVDFRALPLAPPAARAVRAALRRHLDRLALAPASYADPTLAAAPARAGCAAAADHRAPSVRATAGAGRGAGRTARAPRLDRRLRAAGVLPGRRRRDAARALGERMRGAHPSRARLLRR